MSNYCSLSSHDFQKKKKKKKEKKKKLNFILKNNKKIKKLEKLESKMTLSHLQFHIKPTSVKCKHMPN